MKNFTVIDREIWAYVSSKFGIFGTNFPLRGKSLEQFSRNLARGGKTWVCSSTPNFTVIDTEKNEGLSFGSTNCGSQCT